MDPGGARDDAISASWASIQRERGLYPKGSGTVRGELSPGRFSRETSLDGHPKLEFKYLSIFWQICVNVTAA